MTLPLDILDEIGQTYVPTRKLHQALAKIVTATIQNLEHSRNGTVVQGALFGSSPQTLPDASMHLPLRVDASFYKNSPPTTTVTSRNETLAPSSTSNETRPTVQEHPIASLPWPVNVLESGIQTTAPTTSVTDNTADGPLDDPILWGSMEWTGGWDDFLNAIAM